MSKESISTLFPPRKEGKLNIYFHVSENSGVGYYRQYLPALKLRENGKAQVMISDFKWAEGDHVQPTMDQLFEIMNWADLVVVGRLDIGEFYAQWGGIREFFRLPIIIDTDDDVRNVRPNNPGYEGYHPGSQAAVWNQYSIAKIFDAVTVTTEHLRQFHSKENSRIYVLPNSIDMKWFNSFPEVNKNDGFIRVGFIGSASHIEGMRIIREPMKAILEKYPNVKFSISQLYAHYFADWPEELKKRLEPIPWVALKDWPKGLKEVGLDIGLAPLADNMFNRSKSNLRWLEYSACKIPTIASPVLPYRCIKNGEDGILAKERSEWFSAIETLILDETKRKKLAENAYQRICTEFDIDRNVWMWENVYNEVHQRYRTFFGEKKKYKKVGKEKYLAI